MGRVPGTRLGSCRLSNDQSYRRLSVTGTGAGAGTAEPEQCQVWGPGRRRGIETLGESVWCSRVFAENVWCAQRWWLSCQPRGSRGASPGVTLQSQKLGREPWCFPFPGADSCLLFKLSKSKIFWAFFSLDMYECKSLGSSGDPPGSITF